MGADDKSDHQDFILSDNVNQSEVCNSKCVSFMRDNEDDI